MSVLLICSFDLKQYWHLAFRLFGFFMETLFVIIVFWLWFIGSDCADVKETGVYSFKIVDLIQLILNLTHGWENMIIEIRCMTLQIWNSFVFCIRLYLVFGWSERSKLRQTATLQPKIYYIQQDSLGSTNLKTTNSNQIPVCGG